MTFFESSSRSNVNSWSMILSENRYPLFGIMLVTGRDTDDCDRRIFYPAETPISVRPLRAARALVHRAGNPLRRRAGGAAVRAGGLLQHQRVHDLRYELSFRRSQEFSRHSPKRGVPAHAR